MGALLRPQFEGPESKTCANCGTTFYRDKRCTRAYWERAKFCSRECFGKHHARVATASRPAMRDEFDRWIDKSGDCWLWTGARDKDGYGIFSYAGRSYRANKVALELDGRAVGAGRYACHTCDNPPCVRPEHLYPGTPTQNMQDAKKRDRLRIGERNTQAKLTEAAVRHIRASGEGNATLARQFGVSSGAVLLARAGKTWKHVQ